MTSATPRAVLRQQADAWTAEYRRHLIEHQCQELTWCAERRELDDAADAAYRRLERVPAVGAA